jgi:hypothetical protein
MAKGNRDQDGTRRREPVSPDDVPAMMAGADPELRALWLEQSSPADSPSHTLDAEDRERAMIMAQPDADPQLPRRNPSALLCRVNARARLRGDPDGP